MYKCSDAFHEAVKNGNEQKALLIFKDCVFTDDDINVDTGIRFTDYFNLEEDLSIGQAPSNEISFGLFNDDRLLNDYEFGEFLATIGVLLGTARYTQQGSVMVNTRNAKYVGYESSPYLTRGGSRMASPPAFSVKSLLGYDGKLWAFGTNGKYAVYDDATGANITSSNRVNSFMRKKSRNWAGKGMFYNKDSRMLMIYEAGTRKQYEFVPLGWFIAERPKAPDVIQIDMTCYDLMQKFDVDMPTAEQLGLTYPTTINRLFRAMCDYAGVSYRTTAGYINFSASIKSEPEEFANATMRDVLKWIAEAAGSNACFDRDGYLVMKWLNATDQNFEANRYSNFNPYWYETKKVTKLQNRNTMEVQDLTYGSGDETYLIQDNPLLKGVE